MSETQTAQTARPLLAHSRAELERRVIAAAREIERQYGAPAFWPAWANAFTVLCVAVRDLDTWTEQRAAQTEEPPRSERVNGFLIVPSVDGTDWCAVDGTGDRNCSSSRELVVEWARAHRAKGKP